METHLIGCVIIQEQQKQNLGSGWLECHSMCVGTCYVHHVLILANLKLEDAFYVSLYSTCGDFFYLNTDVVTFSGLYNEVPSAFSQ